MSVKTETTWPEEIERLAREAEKVALTKADEIFEAAAEEHERQTAGYRFECRRFGDFLSVFIERAGNGAAWWATEPERKLASSLNIGRASEIKLLHGHCFDRRGALSYHASMVSDEGAASGWGTGAGTCAPWKGYHYEVYPNYPGVPPYRPMLKLDEPKQDRNSSTFGDRSYQPKLRTENYPRSAEDDAIRFNGIGATIYAPAGLGQSVFDAIMAEISRGFDRPEVPA